MYLSDFDLQQLDEQKLMGLPAAQKEALLVKLLGELKEARERLKINSQTSSRPPRSDPPWQGNGAAREDTAETVADGDRGEVEAAVETGTAPSSDAASTEAKSARAAESLPKKLGRPAGAPGQSRSLTLPVGATVVHTPGQCVVCGQSLAAAGFIARTGL